jgi:hypothetical protein
VCSRSWNDLILLGRSAEVLFDQAVIAGRTRRDPIAVEKHIRELT